MDPNQNKPALEAEVVQVAPEAAISLITKAEIDSQISTAKAFPRSLATFHKRVLDVATINEDIAQSCIYALPRGGKTLEGPSVRLAEIVASAYGNLRSGDRVIFVDEKTITAQGIVHDLENNILYTAEVQRRITDKNGRRYNDDMIVVTGRAACAIAFRNAMFKVVPAALIEDVYQKIKDVARGDEKTLGDRREKAIKFFTERGIKEQQIYDKLEAKGKEDINLDKLQTLSGMKSAFVNGEATLTDLFAPDDATRGANATDSTLKSLNKKDAAKNTTGKMEKDLNKVDGQSN